MNQPALRNVFTGASAKLSDVIGELRRALPQGPQFCSVLRGHLEPYAYALAVMDSANSLPENIRALASGLRSVAWCLDNAADECARELREEEERALHERVERREADARREAEARLEESTALGEAIRLSGNYGAIPCGEVQA